jgi:hypothetical protein
MFADFFLAKFIFAARLSPVGFKRPDLVSPLLGANAARFK